MKPWNVLIPILLLAVVAPCAHAAGRTAVLITLEGVSLDELAGWNLPEVRRLIGFGAVGLMNDKTAGAQNMEDNAVTIGAGTRGLGFERPAVDSYSRYAWNADEIVDGEPAGTIYRRNTGLAAPVSSVVQTRIAAIISANQAEGYEVMPGMLGELLGKAGVAVSVYGNSDRGPVPFRSGVMIAMDTRGLVPRGDVGQGASVKDPSRPYGVRANYGYILDRICAGENTEPTGQDRFIVVEAGDAGRVEAASADLLPEQATRFKRLAVRECARFTEELLRRLHESPDRHLIILAVAAPGATAYALGDRLTPLVLMGSGIGRGVAVSSTTRRKGLVTNLDVTATVLAFFGVKKHPSMLGMPITALRTADPIGYLTDFNHDTVRVFNARRPVVYVYVACVILTAILAILVVVVHGLRSSPLRFFSYPSRLRFLLTAPMIAPAVLYVAPLFGIHDTASTLLFLALATSGLTWLMNRFVRDSLLLFGVVGALVSAVIVSDTVAGSWLAKRSIFGYDPVAGLRFYGIGNESVGVLMGAMLLGGFCILDRARRVRPVHFVILGLIFAALTYLSGAPAFGTNFGGMLALLAGFGFALLRAVSPRSWMKAVVVVVPVAIALAAVVVLVNVTPDAEHQTHIGRALTQTGESGVRVLADLAVRKWAMNVRLMKYSAWTYVLVFLVAALVILLIRPVGLMKSVLRKHPMINAGFAGTLIGILVAMGANDSGIVMAATSILYVTMPLIFLARMESWEGEPPAEPKPRS